VARAPKFKTLEAAIGYTFKDKSLLERALTHASTRTGRKKPLADNERLEFLGDRVLGLVIAEFLVEQHPDAAEGELARRFNRLVRGETCAMVARSLGVGPVLILSQSESDSGGRDKNTILADAAEAILGAIFLEAGFSAARDAVRRLWAPVVARQSGTSVDPKSALQEWAQGAGLALPEYVVISRDGPDHRPQFTAEVRIAGRRPSRGEGASKRAAEQAAATAMLVQEGLWNAKASA
jgi:ribonuclease-3